MQEEREFICVTCPVGSSIRAIVDGDQVIEIVGNSCKRGEAFVREEISNPRRMLTTTVSVDDGILPLVPVHSSQALPKHLVQEAAKLLRGVHLQAPIASHQTVMTNILGTGVDIVTSRAVSRSQKRT